MWKELALTRNLHLEMSTNRDKDHLFLYVCRADVQFSASITQMYK